MYEGSSHVPFALKMPKSWKNRGHGTAISSPVTHADILPTLCAAAGGVAPDSCDGRNLLAVARGETAGRDYLESTCNNGQYFSITDGKWKYIFYPEGEQEQLFDLQNDPDERLDLAGEAAHEAKRHELQTEMVNCHVARGSDAVEGEKMKQRPLRNDSLADRRAGFWPGYHTEHYGVDVRH